MEQEEIIVGNKLIADFIKDDYFIVKKSDPHLFMADKKYKTLVFHSYAEAEQYRVDKKADDYQVVWPNDYNTDWNLLMPVVEKISMVQFTDDSWEGCEPYQDFAWPRTFGMRDMEGNYMVRFNANALHTAPTLIEATWLAVVDFIQMHNSEQSVQECDTGDDDSSNAAK